jgi:hypothetical protein
MKRKNYVLKNKVEKILLQSSISPCKRHQNHIKTFNSKLFQYQLSPHFQHLQVERSSRFENYTQIKQPPNLQIDHIDLSSEGDFIFKKLVKHLTLEELELVFKDVDFYIQNPEIRETLDFVNCDNSKLYQILNKEEEEGRTLTDTDRVIDLIKSKIKIMSNKKTKPKFFDDIGFCSDKDEIEKRKQTEIEQKLLKEKIHSNKIRKRICNQQKIFHHKTIASLLTESEKEIKSLNSTFSKKNQVLQCNRILSEENLNNNNIPLELITYRKHNHKKINSWNVFSRNSSNYIKSKSNEQRKTQFGKTTEDKNNIERDNNYYIGKYTKQIKEIFFKKKEDANRKRKRVILDFRNAQSESILPYIKLS